MKWLITVLIALPIFGFSQGANQDLLDQINRYRKKRLLPPLEYTDKHQPKTDAWSRSISKHFGHSFHDPYYRECISKDFPREEIIPDFMASKPHRKNLMSRKAKKVCIAVLEKDNVYYTVIRTFR